MPIEIFDKSRLPKDLSIFFCWQDHLDKKTHRFLIANAIDGAISRIQDELPEDADSTLRRDEATKGRAGSVEIANVILEKIRSSTVIIGDVTPVLSNPDRGLYYPNPNVMAEIAYGARGLGWNRIICVYNEAACKPDQLPFDIRHRRVTGFSCADRSARKEATARLEGILVSAIRAVIQEIGRGEIDSTIGDDAIRHERDLRLLRHLMSTIHRPTLDRFIERGMAYQVHYDCLYFWHGYDAVVCSSDFRFYDSTLQRLALELHSVWGATIHHGSYAFGPGLRPGSLVLLPEDKWTRSYTRTVRAMERAYNALPGAFKSFLDHVHQKFVEIDMDETDAIAWERNLPYIDGTALKRIMDDEPTDAEDEGES